MPTKPRDPWQIQNTQQRRAALIVDMLYDQAGRIVASMDEPPPGMQEPDTDTVRAMWTFSPYGPPARADRILWQIHDMLLPGMLAQIAAQTDLPGEERLKAVRAAHQQAELQALQKVYPQRAKLVQLGVTTIQRSVKLAERAQRLVARGEPHQKPHEMPRVEEVTGY